MQCSSLSRQFLLPGFIPFWVSLGVRCSPKADAPALAFGLAFSLPASSGPPLCFVGFPLYVQVCGVCVCSCTHVSIHVQATVPAPTPRVLLTLVFEMGPH